MIVEYRPSVEGLKNIYSKLLTLGSWYYDYRIR